MALKPNTNTAAAPAFEGMDDDVAVATPPAAPAPTQTAVAAPRRTAVGMATAMKPAFGDKLNVLAISDIEAMGYGAFPRMIATQGALKLDDLRLGAHAVIEIMSWNLRYMAVTNTPDTESKEKVRVSYDGETISNDGASVRDYIDALKAEGYDKASVKTYGDLWGLLVNSDKGGEEAEPKMIQVQLSPQSLQQWKRFQLEQGIKQARGGAELAHVKIVAEARSLNGNDFTIMTFQPA